MFTGHYGVSFAATVFTPRTSLGTLFLAVQFLDVANALIQPFSFLTDPHPRREQSSRPNLARGMCNRHEGESECEPPTSPRFVL